MKIGTATTLPPAFSANFHLSSAVYRVAEAPAPPPRCTYQTNRTAVAEFMLKEAWHPQYVGKTVSVDSPK
jgi:hypothetical protein